MHVEAEGEVEGHREAEDDDREERRRGGARGRRRRGAEEEVHLRDHREELEDLDDEQQRAQRVEVLHRLQLEHGRLEVDVGACRHRLDARLDLQRVPEGVERSRTTTSESSATAQSSRFHRSVPVRRGVRARRARASFRVAHDAEERG